MKLSLEALKERAEAIASEELLGTISGGLEAACHDGATTGGGMTWQQWLNFINNGQMP